MKKILAMAFLFAASALFAVPDDSLFNLDSEWKDNRGNETKFSQLDNKKYKVLTMIFTSCPSACPLMVSHIKKLDQALNSKQKKNVEYLLFSIDPLDSVETLAAFHEKFGLDDRWKFFKSEDENSIQELAAVVGFKYKKIDTSMYSHGTDVYLLNPDGQMIGKVGQSYKSKDLAGKIPEEI